MIIAIDGPAGSGKSTVCRILARELGYTYLDTGAMYRALAWALTQEGLDAEDEPGIADTIPSLPLRFAIEEGTLTITYRGKRLEEQLRPPEITQRASRISQFAAVRTYLTGWQRALAARGRVVAEGRDMTTVVFPEAPVKVFLTADLATRTARRQAEYRSKGVEIDAATLEAQIRARDEADQKRALAPLRAAPGAIILDTSHLGIAEVVEHLREAVAAKCNE